MFLQKSHKEAVKIFGISPLYISLPGYTCPYGLNKTAPERQSNQERENNIIRGVSSVNGDRFANQMKKIRFYLLMPTFYLQT